MYFLGDERQVIGKEKLRAFSGVLSPEEREQFAKSEEVIYCIINGKLWQLGIAQLEDVESFYRKRNIESVSWYIGPAPKSVCVIGELSSAL